MSHLFHRLRTAAAKRAAFRRTLAELNQMDSGTVDDLGMSRADFPSIARQAVYGV